MIQRNKLMLRVKKKIFSAAFLFITVSAVGYGEEASEFGLMQRGGALPNVFTINMSGILYSDWAAADAEKKTVIIGYKDEVFDLNDKLWKFYGGYSSKFGSVENYILALDKISGTNVSVYGGYIENAAAVQNNAIKLTNSNTDNLYGGYAAKSVTGGGTIRYFGDVRDNMIIIENDIPDTYSVGNVYAGYGKNVVNNKIYLKNATVKGELTGGKTDELSRYEGNELILLSADNKVGSIDRFDTIKFGIAKSEGEEIEYPLTKNDMVLIEKPALGWTKDAVVLRVNSANNISAIDASGIDFSSVDFSSKDTLGESMVLISSKSEGISDISVTESVNINDNGNISKIELGSFKDFDDGLTVSYEPFQHIVSEGKAVISKIKGKVKEIVFGAVPWKTEGSLIEKTENLDFNGAKVDTTAINFKNVSELNSNDSMILVEGFGATDVANIVGTEYTIGTTLRGEGSAKIENENLIFTVKTGTIKPKPADDESASDDSGDDDSSWIDEEEEKRKQEEEQKRLEEERKKREEEKRLEEERKKWEEEQKRLEEERKKREEEQKRLEEERKKREEEQKRLEEERKKREEEQKRLEEEKKKQEEEQKRLEEERKKREEEQKRLEEEKRKREEEQKRIEEERKKQEEEARRQEAERQEKLRKAKLKVQEQTHNAVMGIQAGMVALSSATEYIETAVGQISTDAKTSSDGVAVYAGAGGGASKTDTGSGVNAHTWNAIVAVGQERQLTIGDFFYGAFFEYGKASYTIEPDNGMDGTSKYTGGGIFAKWKNPHNTYIEGSFRAGSLQDSADGILEDVEGNRYGYSVSSSYVGAHIGLGHIYRLKNGCELDVYGKFFYTRRGGISYDAGGHYELDAVKSKVLRAGARYGRCKPGWNSYIGVSYAYEFEGVARGTADGYAIRSAKTTGGTVYGEIGLRLLPSAKSKWKSDIAIKAHTGKSRGFSGHFSIAYLF